MSPAVVVMTWGERIAFSVCVFVGAATISMLLAATARRVAIAVWRAWLS